MAIDSDGEATVPGNRPARARGQVVVSRALWHVRPGVAELRTERLAPPRQGEARVATRYSAISRGTERLVSLGQVPQSEWDRMRAPMQSGHFPFPVKYGYAAVGIVTAGPEALMNRRVFALHPHQDYFQVPETELTPIPDEVSDRRATLAANMETALNAHWDAGTGPGDSVLVIGAGVIGLLTAFIAKRIVGCRVAITDIDGARAEVAARLGVNFTPTPTRDNAIVFHTTATSAGLNAAVDAAAFEARIIELSWYGDQPATLRLGGAFHSRRLQIISSQVGHVAASRRLGVTHKQRLALALAMLDDPALDVLVSDEVQFDRIVESLPTILSGGGGLAPLICYT